MSGNTSQPSPEKILCILCIDVNQIQIYPCLTMNRFPATRRKRLFQISPAPALPCGSFESETTGPYTYREQGPCPVIWLTASLNIDTQDRQDKQDEKLLHKKLIGSIIECAFVENLSVLRGPSRTPFESIPTP